LRINSNQDLGTFLFDECKLPSLRKTPASSNSVSLSVLERLRDFHADSFQFLQPIIEYKKAQSLAKAVKILFKKMDDSGWVHPEFNQFGCPSGRIYSYIQTLPKEVRTALIPDEENHVFIEFDWSHQELRILGALSEEPVFLECFSKGEDLHKTVISRMFNKPASEVTPEERKQGKTINYALLYGQEADGLAWNLNISKDKAQELINQYFISLPRVKQFIGNSCQRLLKEGIAMTAFGRKTLLDLTAKDINKEIRRGFNHQIQGTGADLLKATLIKVSEALKDQNASLKMCSHDALYIEAKKYCQEKIIDLVKPLMETSFRGTPFPVTVRAANNLSMEERACDHQPN
ncbi:MAG TPA: DNA polymerase A family protein, partial [Thermodesulfobacteriota bacterium]|nr:DNA polymerase A family protein [Thermodesulfobacteriota bacterium]